MQGAKWIKYSFLAGVAAATLVGSACGDYSRTGNSEMGRNPADPAQRGTTQDDRNPSGLGGPCTTGAVDPDEPASSTTDKVDCQAAVARARGVPENGGGDTTPPTGFGRSTGGASGGPGAGTY